MADWINPITRKRLARFRTLRRAWWSLWLLTGLYGLSLFSNLLCNDLPLLVRFEGRTYFPIFRFYPESAFTGSDRSTRPNYKALAASPAFTAHPDNWMVFPPIPHSPHEIIPPSAINIPDEVLVNVQREPRVGSVDFNDDGRILRSTHAFGFFGMASDAALRDRRLGELLKTSDDSDLSDLPDGLAKAMAGRFANQPMPAYSARVGQGRGAAELSLPAFTPSERPPRLLRITLREVLDAEPAAVLIRFGRETDAAREWPPFWDQLSDPQRQELRDRMAARFEATVPDSRFETADGLYRVRYERESVTYPFRPTPQHPLGLDSSGRDVRAHILYALRTSMSFGLLLVVATMLLGIVVGALQGYFGGWVDITSQRMIEIWSALPFLYIIILLGSIYGRSFTLLLICYGIFNWIGISYYIRAEFLKLRKLPFVEAARVMGLKRRRIIFKHILPNALVPVITFFPFSLVGAIGSLAALDYLGFGLPATTPSWGALLAQAQEFRFAWWLVLYPSLSLFIVILLGVFIGEGVRSAFDPRAESRME